MGALFYRMESVAPYDVSVLIQGETGTGKDLVARAIQRVGDRAGRPFEVINCGALTRELLLRELFGHERGAFTGAVVTKHGLLAAAHGGTVFLEEVGDLPLDAQVMLLRFLQGGEIRPVGSTAPRRVNVRVIAATHRDLAAAVESGAFQDLYYRPWSTGEIVARTGLDQPNASEGKPHHQPRAWHEASDPHASHHSQLKRWKPRPTEEFGAG